MRNYKEKIKILNPFAYKANFSLYPELLRFIQTNPDLLKEICNGEKEMFHHFCKEVSASLKTNILTKKTIGKKLRSEIADILEKYVNLIKPKVIYFEFTGRKTEAGILIKEHIIKLKGKSLHKFFNRNDWQCKGEIELYPMFLYLVTIGSELEEEVKRLSTKGMDIYRSFLLNGIGAGATDTVALDLQRYLEDKYKIHLKRISPGYSDWDISEQKIIFEILRPEQTLGVSLTRANFMYPAKSTSGLMGTII
jgi:hypothetical protein